MVTTGYHMSIHLCLEDTGYYAPDFTGPEFKVFLGPVVLSKLGSRQIPERLISIQKNSSFPEMLFFVICTYLIGGC